MLSKGIPLIILLFLHASDATISFDAANDDFRDCGNGKPLPAVDFSKVEIISEEDGSISLNGSAKLLADYKSPIMFRLYSEKLQQGNWVPGLISRNIRNLCSVLQMPHEVWYTATRHMHQKMCPYLKGYAESIDNINIGNYAEMIRVPPSFIGEWKLYYDFTVTRNGQRVEECIMIPVTISEV